MDALRINHLKVKHVGEGCAVWLAPELPCVVENNVTVPSTPAEGNVATTCECESIGVSN